MTNALLAAAEQQVEKNLTPENQANYMKAVVAGMKASTAGGPESIIASLKDSQDPVRDCAIGAINLSLILRKQSRGTMPLKCMIPAAMTLMLKGLEAAENMGILKVGPSEVSQAARVFSDHLMKCFGITGQMLKDAVGKVQGIAADPSAMAKMNSASSPPADQAASQTPAPGAPQ